MKKLLFIYTRLFDPFIMICSGYLLIFFKFGSFPKDFGLFFGIIIINLVIPIFYFLKLIKEKKVGNWDVTNKKERRKLIGPLIIFIIISTIIIFISSDRSRPIVTYLLRIQLSGILLFSYMYIVSPFFKSSGHVGTISILYVFLLRIFGNGAWWFIILIAIQAVARVFLKKHTSSEVLAGFISGIIIGNLVFLF